MWYRQFHCVFFARERCRGIRILMYFRMWMIGVVSACILPIAADAFLKPGGGCRMRTQFLQHSSAPACKGSAPLPLAGARRSRDRRSLRHTLKGTGAGSNDDDILLSDFPLYNNDVCVMCNSSSAPPSTRYSATLPVNSTSHDNPPQAGNTETGAPALESVPSDACGGSSSARAVEFDDVWSRQSLSTFSETDMTDVRSEPQASFHLLLILAFLSPPPPPPLL